MTNYGVEYGEKNDGPRVVPAADKDAAKSFAESVGGKVVELDDNGAKVKRAPTSRPTPAKTGDGKTPPPAG